MTCRHQRSPYRFLVDRFVAAHLPNAGGLVGLDIGGPSPQPRPPRQTWAVVQPPEDDVQTLTRWEDRSVDVIQCTDMLYLVPQVRDALYAMRRVLRWDGHLVLTVPFLWPPTGETDDWGRWTETKWVRELGGAGFRRILIRPLGGPWSYVEQCLHAYLDWWPPLFCRLDYRHRWPLAYGIVARP